MASVNPIDDLPTDALWEASADGLLLADASGIIAATNPSLDELFRYGQGELIGEPVERLVPVSQREGHVIHRQSFESDRRPRPMAARNLEGLRCDGTRFALSISLAPVDTVSGPMTFASVRDLTERAVSERALAEANRRRAIAEDHDRIAKELHDSVIQRLFALGLGLQGVPARIEVPDVADRVSSAVDALDEIIRDIRSTIYGLREPQEVSRGLRSLMLALASEAEPGLGFVPDVSLSGDLDRVGDRELIGHVASVVREALSNAVRHAGASSVSLTVSVHDSLVVEVIDNGVGIDQATDRRSGLTNLADRASECGGSFELSSTNGGGTSVRWSVPGDRIS